jgi:hypothetical protein
MRFFGTPYPREQADRLELLPRLDDGDPEEWNPFSRQDDRFYRWLHAGKNRWERAADAYARRVRG